MKTIREWLEELPEPYRTQAIDNATNEDGFRDANLLVKNRCEAIYMAFIFRYTPQGSKYWSDFANRQPH